MQEIGKEFVHNNDKMVRLWSDHSALLPLRDGTPQSFEDVFRWAAKKAVWHTDAERVKMGNRAGDLDTRALVISEEEDLFVDMFRYVWIPAVDKWDEKKPLAQRRDPTDPKHAPAFFRWVMYLMGHYLTDLKRIHMTQKEKARRDTEALEHPSNDDPWEAAWGEGVLEEKIPAVDVSIDEIGLVVTEIEDREWLLAAMKKIQDNTVKSAVAVLVKYYGTESVEDLQGRLRRVTGMTFPKLKKLAASNQDVRALVAEGLRRLPDEVKKPRRRKAVAA